MLHFKQTLFSICSSLTVMAVYYLLCITDVIYENTFEVLVDALIIIFVLLTNLFLGFFFGEKLSKPGYMIQFAVLLIVAILSIAFQNTYFYNVSLFLNPINIYGRDIVWQFNTDLSETLPVNIASVILSSALPCLLVFFGSKIKNR